MVDRAAVKIGYHTDIKLSDSDEKFVWDLIDFGYFEDKILSGKCSLSASILFNIKEFEQKLDRDIAYLQKIAGTY